MTAFSDDVLPRGGSKQFLARGKHDLFPAPLPIQPLKKGFCESCSNFMMLTFHSSTPSTVLPPLPVPPRSNQINPPTPNKKNPALFCHLKESDHCTLRLKKKKKKFIIFWQIRMPIMLLKGFIVSSLLICKAVFLFQSQTQTRSNFEAT